MEFTSLNHHLDLPWLREAYRRTRKDGAVGVDGQTAADYEANLEENLRQLLERAKSGTYFAPPVRRVHIPKGTRGDTRPIGIPEGCLGGEAEDGPEPVCTSGSYGGSMVPAKPPSTDSVSAPDPESEAAWPLRVLRDHQQRLGVVAVPPGGGSHWAQMAIPPSA